MSAKKSSLIAYVLSLLAVLFVSTSCGDNYLDNGMLPQPGDDAKEITRFTVNGVDGTITGTSIAMQLPAGTALTNLVPTIVHTGASVSPASGVPKDFSTPVIYTVTAVDGSTQPYTVTITTAGSDSKDITRFTLAGVDGTINGTSIAVTVPFGTNILSAAPTIVHTGVSVSPPSGIAQNFSTPKSYTVTAENGSTKTYTVTVTIAANSAKDIVQFRILGVDGTINGTNISVVLPFGSTLTNLTPTIVHTGIAISPMSGMALNFSSPVQYVVMAADMSTKTYTVTVTVAQNSAKDITQFTILGIDGTIIGTSISLVVPFGTSLAALTPTIVHTGASIAPTSGATQNFTGPVQYTVTAADGSTKTYTVTVTAAPSSAKDITQFTILGIDGTIGVNTISLIVPFGTDLSNLTPTITHTGASISPLSGAPQSFIGPVQYIVTAADGSAKIYFVTVTAAANSAKDITQFTINGVNGVITGTNITVTLPFGTNRANLTPFILHTGVSVSPPGGSGQDFTSARQYVVTAADGSTQTYTVTVNLALDDSKDIIRFTIMGVDGVITGTTISVTLPFGTNPTSLTPTIVITGVSVSPASGVAQDFTSARQYVVTAMDGSTKTYTVTVTVALNDSKDITSFVINGVSGIIIGTSINVQLPAGTNVSGLIPIIQHTGTSIAPASGVAQDFSNPVSYTVTAADGSTKVYIARVTILPSTSKDITSFVINGVSGVIGQSSVTVVLPPFTPLNSLTPTITHTGVGISPASGAAQDFTSPVTYTVTAADGSTKNYVVTVIAATLVSINVTPANPSIAKGTDRQFTATGTYSDNSTLNITSMVTWSSSLTNIATISSGGLAHGENPGTTTITATLGAISGSTTLQVTAAQLVSISVTPSAPSIAKGTDQQFTATGTYTDNSTQNITAAVTWSSSLPSVATIAASGLAHGEDAGTTTITATLGAISGSTTLEVTNVVLVSIAITPNTPSIAKGTSQSFTATGTYSDNSTQNLTGAVTWSSSLTNVATISGAGVAFGANPGTTTITATLDGISGTATLEVTAATLVSIAVTPSTASIAKGTNQQFIATGTYTDNSTQPLTDAVAWSSSDTNVATISSASPDWGVAHGANTGTTTITASLGMVSGTATLTVTAATLVSIAVTPIAPSIAKGTSQQFTATGTYTDSSTQPLTNVVTWSSSDGTVAPISSASPDWGLAFGANPGTTTITATLGMISGSTTLEVTAATLVSIAVTPSSASIAKGTNQAFVATGTYTDNSTQTLTTTVTWSSSMPAVATISSASPDWGVAHGADTGTTTITATLGAISGTATLQVTAATLVSIAVTPTNPSIAKGTSQQFTATGTYTDNSTQNLTQAVTWSSSLPAVAPISNASPDWGLAFGATAGTTTITATLGAVSGSTTLQVTAATLVSIAVTPPNPSAPKGTDVSFTATGTYTDSTTQNLTQAVTWSSSDTNVAPISSASPDWGVAFAANTGTTTITATLGAISGSTSLQVTAASLVSIAVTPPTPSIAKGTNQQFTATGTYTDGTTQDLTTAVTWSSSLIAVATISNVSGSRGLAHAEDQGTTTITATLGAISGTATLTVTAATLVSIEVLPFDPTMPDGTALNFTATGTYTDGSTQDLTAAVTWTTTDGNVATVSNAPPTNGRVVAVDPGTATIRATLGAIFGESEVTVTSAVLVAINIAPADPSIALGTTQPFQAIGVYSDNSTQDLTATVTWASLTPAVATISNAGLTKGTASTVSVGMTTITATLGSVMGMTTLTVSAATIVRIDVTPANPTMPRLTTDDFTAIAVYSDATTQDITTTVTWSSSSTNVATISNANNSEGEVSTINAGQTTITAFDPVSGMSGSTLLTVTNGLLESIEVIPNPATIAIGARIQFTAIGHYSDGTTRIITNSVSWSSSQQSVAGASNGRKKRGITIGKKAGTVTITATDNATGISGSATLTVTSATLTSIEVLPPNTTIPNKTKQYFTALGHFSDGSTSDLTAAVSWTSTSTAVATISNQPFNEGIATGASPGTTTIRALDTSTNISGTTSLTVSSATLVSIAVTPASSTVIIGVPQQMTATATFSDASTKIVTREVTWTSMNTAIATISNAFPTQGLATGVATGSTTINAQYPLTNVIGSTGISAIP
ncbi:MAG: Ig-like domain-containing protein [Myxococcales bacterium]|nr:Ig-like domain-containing protein [Myxococcales bacterium]